MTRHFLNCQCGHQFVVATEDSGIRLACPKCKTVVTVPELNSVKALPLAPEPPAKAPSPSVFSLGTCLIILGALQVIAAAILRPWGYRYFLNEPVPEKYVGSLSTGLAMLAVGIVLTWLQRRDRGNRPS